MNINVYSVFYYYPLICQNHLHCLSRLTGVLFPHVEDLQLHTLAAFVGLNISKVSHSLSTIHSRCTLVNRIDSQNYCELMLFENSVEESIYRQQMSHK